MTTTIRPATRSRVFSRPFEDNTDWWQVRDLLIETYPITPLDFNWEFRRWDGQRFHRKNTASVFQQKNNIRLWETQDRQLVGAVHPEDPGFAFLELHPDYRFLEQEMIDWAESHLAVPIEGVPWQRQVTFFVYEYNVERLHLLEMLGYERTPWMGVARRLCLDGACPPRIAMAQGYTLRQTRPEAGDYQRIADVLNAGFGRTFHSSQEIANFATLSPGFRHDLDLMAEAADGSFAAYVGLSYDAVNRRGLYEPVCTHPDHRRRGLARALMLEGLRRLKAIGAVEVTVCTGDADPANALYDSFGFTECYWGHFWRKVF